MDELKSVFASNLIKLRTASGMTQAELGEKINYSDKSISKWERAEALPDAFNLKKLAEIFNTTVDALLSEEPTILMICRIRSPAIQGRQFYSSPYPGFGQLLCWCLSYAGW
ncbi:MAG: helix-turn-helix transcriptional regulator [Oscillospiraceae bacterium]|nr:helix-turn-helix transcriptional regulator [Oscillospiraceae bacterium]